MSSIANLINLSMGLENEEVLDTSVDQMSSDELDDQLEAQENALELGEANAMADATEAVEEHVESIKESVESFHNRLRNAKLSERGVHYVNYALTQHMNTMGLTSHTSVESDGSNLEYAFESFNSTTDEVLSSLRKAKVGHLKRVSTLLKARRGGLESADGEEEVVPAGDIDGDTLTEVSEIAAADQIDNTETTNEFEVADIVNDVKGDVEAGELSEDDVEAAQMAVESLYMGTGVKPVHLKGYISGQSFDLEGYSASMEKIFIRSSTAENSTQSVIARIANSYIRAFGFLNTRAKLHKVRLNKLMAKADQSSGKTEKITANVRYLHKDGEIPSNLPTYISQYANWVAPIIGTFHKSAAEAYKANSETIKSLSGKDNTVSDIEKLRSNWKDPRDQYRNLDFSVPGGRRLFADVNTKSSSDKLTQFFLDKAHKNYPTQMLLRKEKLRMDITEISPIKPADIKKTSQDLIAAIDSINKGQALMESVASIVKMASIVKGLSMTGTIVEIMPLIAVLVRRAYRGVEGKDELAKAVNAAMKTSRRMCFHVAYDAAATTLTVSSGWIKAAKASL